MQYIILKLQSAIEYLNIIGFLLEIELKSSLFKGSINQLRLRSGWVKFFTNFVLMKRFLSLKEFEISAIVKNIQSQTTSHVSDKK